MSVESLAAVLHHSRAKGTAKLVLVGIANHDGDGGAWPTVRTLARYANVDPRNVQRSLEKLVSIGELVIHVQAGGTHDMADHDRPNRYDVLVGCPVWCDRTTQHRDTRATKQSNLRGIPGGATATPRVAKTSPPRVALASPKPSSQPDPPTQVETQPEDARAVCAVCTRPRHLHDAAQRKLALGDRHGWVEVERRASG